MQPVWLKNGRFGPYVEEPGEKTKRASLPKTWPPASMDIDKALRLLDLPRDVGTHPEDGKMIQAGIGRYGPYVLHDGAYANLESADEVFEVGLNRAVSVLAEKRAGGRGARGTTAALKELGNHPEDGAPIKILSGRFGPYIKHGATNANVPRGKDPLEVTLDEAVALIAERVAKGGGKKPVKKAAAKKAPAAKAPAKAKAASADKPPAMKPAEKRLAAKKALAKKKPAVKKVGAKKAAESALLALVGLRRPRRRRMGAAPATVTSLLPDHLFGLGAALIRRLRRHLLPASGRRTGSALRITPVTVGNTRFQAMTN
jgi:DNA topoisomerase-1